MFEEKSQKMEEFPDFNEFTLYMNYTHFLKNAHSDAGYSLDFFTNSPYIRPFQFFTLVHKIGTAIFRK